MTTNIGQRLQLTGADSGDGRRYLRRTGGTGGTGAGH